MSPSARGQIKAGKGTLIGNSGEYFVVGTLLRRGVIAALTPRNTPGFDVIATLGSTSANLRVKTKTEAAADSWVFMAKKDGAIFRNKCENDFTVLVDLKGTDEVDYFVLPTPVLEERLRSDQSEWSNHPGLRGRVRNPDNPMHRIGQKEEQWTWLNEYRSAWNLIFEELRDGAN